MEKRFLYRSSAIAFGGRITRPFSDILDAQAAAHLPITGGYGTSKVQGYRYRDMISFRAAYATVSGSESQSGATTIFNSLATVTIEGLNVMDVVTADKIVARLASEQSADSDDLPIVPVGSHFVNLRVANVPVDPRPHAQLLSCRSFTEIEAAHAKSASAFVDPDGNPFKFQAGLRTSGRGTGKSRTTTFQDRILLTSLFEAPAVGGAAAQAAKPGKGACRLEVPGFGTVHIGEYIVTRYSRHLTMLRLELGSPVAGSVVLADVGGNGHTYP